VSLAGELIHRPDNPSGVLSLVSLVPGDKNEKIAGALPDFGRLGGTEYQWDLSPADQP
jgi:hypothetical protein